MKKQPTKPVNERQLPPSGPEGMVRRVKLAVKNFLNGSRNCPLVFLPLFRVAIGILSQYASPEQPTPSFLVAQLFFLSSATTPR